MPQYAQTLRQLLATLLPVWRAQMSETDMSHFEGLELGTSVRAYFGALSYLMAFLMDTTYCKALLVAGITAILRSVLQIV